VYGSGFRCRHGKKRKKEAASRPKGFIVEIKKFNSGRNVDGIG
jgi:hypothetical protein